MKAFLLLLGICWSWGLLAQSSQHSFVFEGQTRNYRLYVPGSYQPGTPAPLVFNLHGYTSTAQQQELYSGMNAVADTAGCILVYPDGINNAWNSGFLTSYSAGVNDVGFISALIDSLSAQYSIDSLRIYSCGMSNGGFMSFRLACDLQHRIAAIASVTGTMSPMQLDSCAGLRAMPILQIHGTLDGTVPYSGSPISASVDATLNYWRSLNQCSSIVHDTLPDLVSEGSTISTQSQSCSANTEVVHYKVANGGHTWPGAFPIPSLGITNQDINASREIWEFFLKHSRPVSVPTTTQPQAPNLGAILGPNPFADWLEIQPLPKGATFQVLNSLGQILAQGDTQSQRISTVRWPAGIYHFVLQRSGSTYHRTLIKH